MEAQVYEAAEPSHNHKLDPIFKPASVAIIGASNNRERWGHGTLRSIIKAGFRGKIYPVNPREEVIQGIPAYPSILDVPEPVDLAVFVVNAAQCVRAVAECAEKGVRGGVVITAGFAEISEDGRRMQEEMVATAREAGLRFVGPNCLGIWSSAVSLDCCFYKTPKPGPISFVSQSGTLGEYLLEIALDKGYGFSKFISSGNQADLDVCDYLEYLADDPDTKPLPKSNRVAVTSGGGGFCVTTADACASYGLELPELDARTQRQILSLLHPYSPPPRNPVDMIARKGPISHAEIIEILAGLDYIDGIIISPPWGGFSRHSSAEFMKELIDSAERIAAVPKKYGKPIISAGAREYQKHPTREILKKGNIPFFENPDTCARAMAGLVEYSRIREKA
jgi:acyl-CoA synthetase (NDP forming)